MGTSAIYVLLLYHHHQQQQQLLQRRGKSTSIVLFVTFVLFLVVFEGNDTVLVWYSSGLSFVSPGEFAERIPLTAATRTWRQCGIQVEKSVARADVRKRVGVKQC